MKMAATAPMTGNQYGTPGGITKAIKIPVKTALPSLTVTGRPSAFWEIASTSTHDTTLIRVMNKPLSPKLYTDNSMTGIKDADTVHMIPAVVFPNRMCGEMETAHWGSTAGFFTACVSMILSSPEYIQSAGPITTEDRPYIKRA
jgi:hypothetical protein